MVMRLLSSLKCLRVNMGLPLMIVGAMLVGLSGCGSDVQQPRSDSGGNGEETTVPNYAQWLTQPPPKEVVRLVPALAKTPVVMLIQADLCGSCKTLKPKLKQVSQAYPHIPVLDVNLNRKPSCASGMKAYDGILDAMQPALTPTLVFLKQDGTFQNVVVGDQPLDVLRDAFSRFNALHPMVKGGKPLPKTAPADPNAELNC
jgi:thiol-disulfide isomerase/thioredoxin